MYLLVDTISLPAHYILFNSARDIVSEETLELRGRESEYFLDSLLGFLAKNTIKFDSLEGVVVVNGPGSFTAMRIITLTINTLSFVHHIPLYSLDYFSLGELSLWQFPILIRANRGEYLKKESMNSTPELIAIPQISPGIYSGIGDINDFTNTSISIQSNLRYDVFCKKFPLEHPVERIEPFYIKKPNIT